MTRLEQVIVESRKLAPNTQRLYLAAIRDFVAHARATAPPLLVDAGNWTPRAVENWVQGQLAAGTAPQTVNGRLAALKKASARMHALDGTPDFAAAVESARVEKKMRPQRSLSQAEVDKLFATCDPPKTPSAKVGASSSWTNARDRVILCLAVREGMRREEIACARWEKRAGAELTFRAKGRRDDKIMLGAFTLECIAAWHEACGNPTSGPIILSAHGQARERGLTPDGVYKIIKKRAAQAGITRVTPHTLRHTCISLALAKGTAPWRVGLHARHKSLATTMGVYAHDVEADAGRPVGDAQPRPGGATDGK